MSFAIEGVYCAAATPLKSDGTPDLDLFGKHTKALIEEGCHGIAMLGSTGEANSFGVRERMDLLEAAMKGGTMPEQLLPGIRTRPSRASSACSHASSASSGMSTGTATAALRKSGPSKPTAGVR